MNININIQKKDLWLLSAIMIFLVGVGYVVAYNENWESNPGDPVIHGHSPDEIEPLIHFQWVLQTEGCRIGYIDTGLIDDSQGGFHLNEKETDNGPATMLCVKGIENVEWVPSSTGCSSGFIDTGLIDDTDGSHRLGESGESGAEQMFCIKGITEVEWVGNCRPGWVDVHIKDDGDSMHALYESEWPEAGSYTLCVI